MTSARGRSHTFDERADGYARGEACGALVLQPVVAEASLSVEGAAVRCDGRSASLTAPNGQAQRALLSAALGDAGVGAASVARVEAHGTGTALGDPIEVGALAGAVVSAQGDAAVPLCVGSVKANSGHAEPAAGLAVGSRAAADSDRGAAPEEDRLLINQ